MFGHSKQLSKNKFFDLSTPSMRKGCDGEKKQGKKKRKRLMEIVATTSLPAVDCPSADRWNATRLCKKYETFNRSARVLFLTSVYQVITENKFASNNSDIISNTL